MSSEDAASDMAHASTEGRSLDRMGAVASTLCSAHCLVCSLAPSLFGLFGLGVLLSHEAEWALTLLAAGLALVALFFGWRRHRSQVVAVALSAGILGLIAARFLEESGSENLALFVGVGAGLTLVFGHLRGLRTANSP